jgi:hypothetical protein
MTLELTPLAPEQLSEALERAVGARAPAAIRLMAARGLAPLGPKDLVTALYQLSHEPDATVAQTAQKTAGELPDRVLEGALREALDPRVVDFFAHLFQKRPQLVELVLLNRSTDDATFAYLASVCDERLLEMIAGAEDRCLRSPAIVEALYFNRRARMSTVDRLIELCVRNGVNLERVPHFKETAAEILAQAPTTPAEAAVEDELFSEALAAGEEIAEGSAEEADEAVGSILAKEAEGEVDPRRMTVEKIRDLKLSVKMRLATIGTAFHRSILIRDSNKQVALAAVKSPAVGDDEVARYSSNRSLCEDVVRYIAMHREFLKHYQVKVNLVNNPKCPLATSLRLLSHLHPGELKNIARSKSVPATLATTAKRLLDAKKP